MLTEILHRFPEHPLLGQQLRHEIPGLGVGNPAEVHLLADLHRPKLTILPSYWKQLMLKGLEPVSSS